MDIDEFYDQDPRRRSSEETEYGRGWSEKGRRWGVSWVADTGELYAMREATGRLGISPTILLGVSPMDLSGTSKGPITTDSLTVEVLAVIGESAEVDRLMHGWREAMRARNSLRWVRGRIAPSPKGSDRLKPAKRGWLRRYEHPS